MPSKPADPELSQLRSDLDSLSIPALFPSSPDFSARARSYNRVFTYQPAAIVFPTTATSIASTLAVARTHGLKVQPRSGGHSYGAYSAGGQDGSLIVDLTGFSTVTLDTATNVAVVGAGVRLGRLASELFRLGRRAVPHGTIKNVGVGGHFSHGGYGYVSRAWGLALDTIVAMDVVLADGRVVCVTAEQEPELWFVCIPGVGAGRTKCLKLTNLLLVRLCAGLLIRSGLSRTFTSKQLLHLTELCYFRLISQASARMWTRLLRRSCMSRKSSKMAALLTAGCPSASSYRTEIGLCGGYT